jgi:hypothetical protein
MKTGFVILVLIVGLLGVLFVSSQVFGVPNDHNSYGYELGCAQNKDHRVHECEYKEGRFGSYGHMHMGMERDECWEGFESEEEKLSGVLRVSDSKFSLKTADGKEVTLILKGMWKIGEELLEWHQLPLTDGMQVDVLGHHTEKGTFIADEIVLGDGTVITRFHCREG